MNSAKLIFKLFLRTAITVIIFSLVYSIMLKLIGLKMVWQTVITIVFLYFFITTLALLLVQFQKKYLTEWK